ncbi:VOC family protein [Lipingzhangella rawalii]|uniref:VOC family protein n=1 Tax=Lipingzhangella rawalii TaxID=2055835 RepID=UPI00389943D6
MASSSITLVVIYSDRIDECISFYSRLGLHFEKEQHGQGPQHYAAVLGDETVVEIYPANGHPTERIRLGMALSGGHADPKLAPGRHVITDPEGRKVDIHVS